MGGHWCSGNGEKMNTNRIIQLGYIPKTENGGDGKKHESNIVYSIRGISPCVAASFSIKQPPTMIIIRRNK